MNKLTRWYGSSGRASRLLWQWCEYCGDGVKFGWSRGCIIWRYCGMQSLGLTFDFRIAHLLGAAFLAAALLTGCATPRQEYINHHPQLSAEHRRILLAGKLIDRDPVAGMTKEEIRVTMGIDPTQATTINGEEAWVWVKRKPQPLPEFDDSSRSSSGMGSGSFSNLPRESDEAPGKKVNLRTTVFFQGDLATRVDVTEEQVNP